MKSRIIFTSEFCNPAAFFPFTLTRFLQDIRTGVFTNRERWSNLSGLPCLDRKEGDHKDSPDSIDLDQEVPNGINYLVHANVIPDPRLVKAVLKMKAGTVMVTKEGDQLAFCVSRDVRISHQIVYEAPVLIMKNALDILKLQARALELDFYWLAANRNFAKPLSHVTLLGKHKLLVDKKAKLDACILDLSEGPIYIAKNAHIMSGACVRGPVSIGEGTVVKMGATLYGPTSIGPNCIVGGEVKNSVFFSQSNKAHHGYIGDSIIGSWCNMGAGTSNSNIKNNASLIQMYTPTERIDAGNKSGVWMGDYARTAINTSINTGTVIGVGANVFGAGLSPKFIPHFAWGQDGIERYRFDKACIDISRWKAFKSEALSEHEEAILKHIFDHY